MGGKRLTLPGEGDTSGGAGPRVTAEQHHDERPNLDAAADVAGEDGAMDPDALNAALLAVLADEAVSRAGLHRMLSARQRRSLREDSNFLRSREGNGTDSSSPRSSGGTTTPKAENDVSTDGNARSSRGATPLTEHRHRRCTTMDDRWVREKLMFSPSCSITSLLFVGLRAVHENAQLAIVVILSRGFG